MCRCSDILIDSPTTCLCKCSNRFTLSYKFFAYVSVYFDFDFKFSNYMTNYLVMFPVVTLLSIYALSTITDIANSLLSSICSSNFFSNLRCSTYSLANFYESSFFYWFYFYNRFISIVWNYIFCTFWLTNRFVFAIYDFISFTSIYAFFNYFWSLKFFYSYAITLSCSAFNYSFVPLSLYYKLFKFCSIKRNVSSVI